MFNVKKTKVEKTTNSAKIARRELISKYGAYTAPVVVSLLCPATAYADPGMASGATVYSKASTCQADIAANSGAAPFHGGGGRHCMVGGVGGGGNAHTVIDTGS